MHILRSVALSALALTLGGCSFSGGAPAAAPIVASRSPLRITRTITAKIATGDAAPLDVGSLSMTSRAQGYALALPPDGKKGPARLLATTDGGVTWRRRGTLPQGTQTIQFLNRSDGVALSPGELLRTADGGLSWHVVYLGDLGSVRFASAQDGIAIAPRGALRLTRDGGRTWQAALARRNLRFVSVSALQGPAYYALAIAQGGAKSQMVLFASQDGGATWRTLFSGVDSASLHGAYLGYLDAFKSIFSSSGAQAKPRFGQGGSVTFLTPEAGWVSLFDGGALATLVARTEDGGRTFTYAWGNAGCAMGCNAMGGGLYPAAFLGAQDVWRFGPRSVDRSLDGGKTFAPGGLWPLGMPPSGSVRSLRFLTPALGIAATRDGILRTADGGRTWSRVWPKDPGPLQRVSMTASGYGLALSTGQPDLLWRTEDGGRNWRPLRAFPYPPPDGIPVLPQISDFWAFPGGKALVLAGGTAYRSKDAGKTFGAAPLQIPPAQVGGAVYFSGPETGWYLASQAGGWQLYRTRDGGRNWQRGTRFGLGIATCAPVGEKDWFCVHGVVKPKVSAGVVGFALAATTDGGGHFTTVGTMPEDFPLPSLSFYGPGSGALLTADGLLLTQDAGRSFTRVRLALGKDCFITQADSVSAKVVYLLDSQGRLYVTRDGGRSFQEIG